MTGKFALLDLPQKAIKKVVLFIEELRINYKKINILLTYYILKRFSVYLLFSNIIHKTIYSFIESNIILISSYFESILYSSG